MGSLNISIKKSIYEKLVQLKKEGESFSDLLERLMGQKDITRCFGLLEKEKDVIASMQEELRKSRETPWRKIK